MVETILGGLIVAGLVGIDKIGFDHFLTRKILKFLKNSKEDGNYIYRSSHAISAETHMTEEKVRKLCSKCKEIKRNTGERGTWKLLT